MIKKKPIIRDVEYSIDPNSHGRRVSEMGRRLTKNNYTSYQRDWIAVKTPIHLDYSEFSLWFKENCIGYWRYPTGHIFGFLNRKM